MATPAARHPALRDWLLAGIPLALLAGQMSLHGHLPGGVLLGLVLVLASTVGILGLLGDSPLDVLGDEEAPAADRKPWWKREGGWVVLFGGVLYVPLAGAFGLWDPWETHYSEVAREILARDDWITLWWAQEGWFMSKPILVFWMGALGMGVGSLFGLRYQADGGPHLQEWFIRLPIVALAVAALYAIYRAVARAWGPRAGLLAALVLATMPQWFFLAHQAMTDMPFVAALTLAMAMFIMALTTEPGAHAAPRTVRLGPYTLRVSLWHLTVGIFLVTALPQVMYLLTRPMFTGCPPDAVAGQCVRMLAANRIGGLQVPVEIFYSGSAGNSAATMAASVPGSPAWERVASAVPFFPSVLQGVLWACLGSGVLLALRRQRGSQALYYVLFYYWCAISTMGKGPAGIAIPGAVALLHFIATGRWRDLQRIHLGVGVVVFLVVGMPWYVAITGRLGDEFIQRFIVHDIINRTVLGVHGDTGSVRYFLWQLGYAMFPWSGLVPLALVGWRLVVPREATQAQRDVARVAMFWFVGAFVLFSAMVTKFHHYIFPAIPGAAILVGLLLDRMMGRPAVATAVPVPSLADPQPYRDAPRVDVPGDQRIHPLIPLVALTVGVGLVVVGAARCVGGFSGRLGPNATALVANVPLGVFLIAGGSGLWLLAWWLARPSQDVRGRPTWAEAQLGAGLGAVALGAAALVALVTRDLANSSTSPPGSERLIHLFVYNYDRPWPTRFLDFHGPLFGFGAAAVAGLVAVAIPAVRAHAARGLVVLAALFAAWSLDVYMIQVTPHWSQRPLFERYYAMRHARTPGTGEDAQYRFDPIIAHQMNWKGENFYTGNHVVAMECGLKYCTDRTSDWIARHPNWRVFFVTEHSRVAGLISTLRATGGAGHTVTTEADDNKFVLVEGTTGSGTHPSAAAPASHPGVANSQ